jgi:hypothetical protein
MCDPLHAEGAAALANRLKLPYELLCLIASFLAEDGAPSVYDVPAEGKFWKGCVRGDSAIGSFAQCSRSFRAVAIRALMKSIHLEYPNGSYLPFGRIKDMVNCYGADTIRNLSIELKPEWDSEQGRNLLGVIPEMTNVRSICVQNGLSMAQISDEIVDQTGFLVDVLSRLPPTVSRYALDTMREPELLACLSLPGVQQGVLLAFMPESGSKSSWRAVSIEHQ